MNRLAVAAGVPLLIWPAFINAYPLLFSDSAAFIAQLLQPVMIWDKPYVYGPVIVIASLGLTFWFPVIAQGLLLSWMLWRLQSVFAVASAKRHLGLCTLLAFATAAPWFTPMLMPDIFAPIAVLALAILALQTENGTRWPMIAIAAFAIASHLAHLPLAAACVVAIWRLRPDRLRVTLLPIGLAIAILLTTNAVGHKRFGLSPFGSVFLLARLVADGPARDYLAEACPDPTIRLCDWVGRFPATSDLFLWDSQGPVWTYPGGPIGLAPEASRIVAATIDTRPVAVVRVMAANTIEQLVTVRLGHTFVDFDYTRRIGDRLRAHYPAWELAGFMASLQHRNGLRAVTDPWQKFHAFIIADGWLAILALLFQARRDNSRVFAFTLIVVTGLLANAFATGALSGPADRYQARIAWLVLLPPALWWAGRSNTAKTLGAA